jgi:ketosteroid isomerase-like protein
MTPTPDPVDKPTLLHTDESTTPDLVGLVRQAIDASHRGDYDAIMRLFAPNVVWESLDGVGTFEGATAVQGFLEEVTGMFEDFTIKYAASDRRPLWSG